MAIPVQIENEVVIGKSSRSEECGIEFNSSLVKALSSTLYNYKIEAKVNPAYVVSVPYDYSGMKMRVCKFEVLKEVTV